MLFQSEDRYATESPRLKLAYHSVNFDGHHRRRRRRSLEVVCSEAGVEVMLFLVEWILLIGPCRRWRRLLKRGRG